MLNVHSLNSQTSKDLAKLAKQKGVPGWHSMRKAQLVGALLKIAKQKEQEKNAKPTTIRSVSKKSSRTNNKSVANPLAKSVANSKSINRISTANILPVEIEARLNARPSLKQKEQNETPVASDSAIAKTILADRERQENLKNLSLVGSLDRDQAVPKTDRLVLIVRDCCWMQAYWEITKSTVQRAKIALNGSWHRTRPVLRLMEVTSDGNTNSVENLLQEIEIHGAVKNWYLNVQHSAKAHSTHAYRLAIGYAVPDGRFHLICKSNQVSMSAATAGLFDENWTDITNDVEKYYALSGGYENSTVSADLQAVFEEKSRQPMNAPAFERLGSGINGHGCEFEFQVEAHMIVYGTTNPNGSVTVGGEPVRLQRDGTFSIKVDLPDKRQVLPIVASSRDGTQQRTTVLAIERNTKVMEPVTHDMENL